MPERFTDEELRAITWCSWALPGQFEPPGAAAPLIEVQHAVHLKAGAELRARGEAVAALNALVYHHATDGDRTDAAARAWANARRALAALGYALPDPHGGATGEEGERGPQGRQDEAERAQGHREGEGEAGGEALSGFCMSPHCTRSGLHPKHRVAPAAGRG